MLRVLDLFSGIGGFSLGLERAGMRTVAFCEIDPFCRQVLRRRWPRVPIYEDVRDLTMRYSRDAELVCGGFPCQDVSAAGKGAGIEGERSGLWREFHRIIGELRPRYAFVENVAALTFRGLLRVLGDLTEIGYDAQWHCIPASAVGAPHQRDRIWIIAYPAGYRLEGELRQAIAQALHDVPPEALDAWHRSGSLFADWPKLLAEPAVQRVAYGFPAGTRHSHLEAIGNAVCPQVVEALGRAILEAERSGVQ